MEQRTKYSYFTGRESLKFAFIQIPKQLMSDPVFKQLSSDAKLLYGLLLDRLKLSVKNQWFDEENRAYIYYPVEEIMEDLNCGRNKAVKTLQELDTEKGIGLVEKNRQGQGRGSILYVMNFFTEPEAADEKFANETSADKETVSEVYDANFKGVTTQTSRSPECKLAEVCNEDSSNNKYINTNGINIESNHITSPAEDGTPALAMRCDIDEMAAYAEIIKDNIGYKCLLERYPYEQEMVEGIFQLMLETVLIQSDYVLIASNQYPKELVKSKFLKLTFSHIEYVMDCMIKNTTKVVNIKKYLLAALFNAPSTIDGYYKAEVNHSFPQFAR